VAIVCAFLYFRRRPPTPTEFGTQPNVTASDPPDVNPGPPQANMAHISASSLPSTAPLYPSRGSNNIAQTANRSPSADFLTPTRALDTDNGRPSSISSEWKDPNHGGTLSSRPDSPVDRPSPNQLTDDQATYVQNMYSLDVPAPAIALVVERMLQERGAAGESSTGGFGVSQGNMSATMPPSYADL